MKAQRLEQSIAAYARELEEKALALEQAKSRAEEHALALEEEQVRTAAQARQLAEAERLKDRFFANISHEFRTPLTLILGPTRDALEGEYGSVPNPLRRQLSIVRSSGERLLRLVNDLLDLSKLDAGAVRLKPKALDIVEFLRPVVRTFGDLAHRRGIKLTFETDIDLMDLYFDPDAIEKVVYNLVSNALKFTPEKGSVRIRLFVESPDGEKVVCVAVRDTGPGVPPEQIDRIFDRFHQIEGPDSRIQEGTGLGLALVRELVELHGGTVSVDSEPGFGSEFTICLPVHHRVAEPRHSRAGVVEIIDSHHGEQAGDSDSEAREPAGEDAPLVMVVDNDVDVRGYIRGHLESSYRVVEAENGVEALEKIAEGRPSLVICDVMMPRMDGIEFCSRVRKDPELADMPVVLLTALADDESRLEGLRAGADDYMPKPFSSSELLARVENLIEIRSLLRARAAYGVVEPSPIDLPSVDQVFLEKVRSVVEDHIQDSNFGVDWLADEVALSTRQLQRKMKKLTRLSAAGNIRAMRLKRADQLLRRRAGNVSEVAGMVGFRDAAYFTRLFKQTFGRLPSEVLGAGEEEDLLDE